MAATLCIHDLIDEQANHPDKVAVCDDSSCLTFKELNDLSNQLANMLISMGTKPGDKISVMIERSPALIVAMLGIFKIGAMYVPINPKYPNERIDYILADSQSKWLLLNSSEMNEKISARFKSIQKEYSDLQRFSTEKHFGNVNPENVAYVVYTSGTTGQPKGVMIKHVSLVNLASWYKQCFQLTATDRASQFASQGFDTFFCETLPFLANGNSVHIVDEEVKLTPEKFIPWLKEQKITICDLPTAYAQILFSLTWPEMPDLRLVKIGGESITRYPNQALPFDIWNTYGPTEATVETTYLKICIANTLPKDQPLKHMPPPIGKPIAGGEVYVVDNKLKQVPVGSKGELLIGGLIISPGYLNRDDLTQKNFIPNPFTEDKNAKLYKTGDYVRWLADGNLEFIGRIDNQVKIRGYRIEINEIEKNLSNLSDVTEVIVLTRETTNNQKSLVAYLVPDLSKIRIPHETLCYLKIGNDEFIQATTENFSRGGLAVAGLFKHLDAGQEIKISMQLPGMDYDKWFSGQVIWQVEDRIGVKFDDDQEQNDVLIQCVEYYLASHSSFGEALNNTIVKRNLRTALKKKLPEFMVPSSFTVLPEFPLTFNGKIDYKSLPDPIDAQFSAEKFIAPVTQTEKQIAEIWAELLGIQKISTTDNFFDIGGNSLLSTQLSIQLMKQLNVSIPIQLFFNSPTVATLASYIDSREQNRDYLSLTEEKISADLVLDEGIKPNTPHVDIEKMPQADYILLTGVSGFVGVYLLAELLLKTEATIYCLVRADTDEIAKQRIKNNIKQYHLVNQISLDDPRIIVIAANIALPQFGLAQEKYRELASKINGIYHCASEVNMILNYVNLRASNVLGTLEIIKFATYKVDKPIHYISTILAATKMNAEGYVMEVFPDENYNNLISGYAVSKWVSECLLTQIHHRGLPVYIYRLGNIWGPTSGITNLNDSLLMLIKGCIQLGYSPNWNEKIVLLPIDFVVKAIVGIAHMLPENQRVFHLDNPNGIIWSDLMAWLNDYGFKIKLCSHDEWQQHLIKADEANAIYPILSYYLALDTEPKTPPTQCDHTVKILADLNLKFPEVGNDLLTSYMDYLCQINYLLPADKSTIPLS